MTSPEERHARRMRMFDAACRAEHSPPEWWGDPEADLLDRNWIPDPLRHAAEFIALMATIGEADNELDYYSPTEGRN